MPALSFETATTCDVDGARQAIAATAIVARRIGEFGIRAALGATRGDLVQLVLGDSLRLTLVGLAAGAVLAFAASRGLTNLPGHARILVAQPGILEGAGAFDSVARNTVAAAAKNGKHIEFWALDRRSNCLEDHTGVQAGLAAQWKKLGRK